MIEIMLDTNIYDKLIENKELLDLLINLIETKKIIIITTHVQENEVKKIRNKLKKDKIRRIPRQIIPTNAAVWGFSELGSSSWGGGYLKETNHSNKLSDAMIGSTAFSKADILVTEDIKFYNKMLINSNKFNLKCLKFDDFKTFILELSL